MGRRLVNERYDLTGMEVTRVGKLFLLSKTVPIGNFGNGPGIRPLIVLGFYHFFSRPLLWAALRFEPYAVRFFKFLENRRRRKAIERGELKETDGADE